MTTLDTCCPRCATVARVSTQTGALVVLEAVVLHLRCASCGRRWRQRVKGNGVSEIEGLKARAVTMWRPAATLTVSE